MFIGFNGGENADKVCNREPKNMIIGRFLTEVGSGAPKASIQLFSFIFKLLQYFQ